MCVIKLADLAEVENVQYWKPVSRRKVQVPTPFKSSGFLGAPEVCLGTLPPCSCAVSGQHVLQLGCWRGQWGNGLSLAENLAITPSASAAGNLCLCLPHYMSSCPLVRASSPFWCFLPGCMIPCRIQYLFNQTRWHCSVTSWSFPDLLGLIPVQDQFLLAEGPGSPRGLSLSKAGYKLQLSALSLVELESCGEQKLFWMFWADGDTIPRGFCP